MPAAFSLLWASAQAHEASAQFAAMGPESYASYLPCNAEHRPAVHLYC